MSRLSFDLGGKTEGACETECDVALRAILLPFRGCQGILTL